MAHRNHLVPALYSSLLSSVAPNPEAPALQMTCCGVLVKKAIFSHKKHLLSRMNSKRALSIMPSRQLVTKIQF